MTDPSPLVSVVIPTHNRLNPLREAVESVFSQTYDRWELVIVDDGSTDGTRAYLETLRDPRVQVILRERCGNAAALRNAGIRAARGAFIAFLDSDDRWVPGKLARSVAEADAHPESGWVYTAFSYIDEAGSQRSPAAPAAAHRGWILEPLLQGTAKVQTSTVMVRRSVLDAVGTFDEALVRCQDYDLWLRLATHSEAASVNAPLVGFRQHPGQRRESWLDILGFMNRIYAGAMARTSSAKIRRLCRRQRARVALDIVAKSRAAGRDRDARTGLRMSFPHAWWHYGWWSQFTRTMLRPFMPGRLLTYYHALRDRRP
jgi:glycosyltransferase involved in cell wall biosynthesis